MLFRISLEPHVSLVAVFMVEMLTLVLHVCD